MSGTEADDVPRVLARNNACLQCRKRKLKCDAVRPTCGNCAKPRVRGVHAREPPVPCSWDYERGRRDPVEGIEDMGNEGGARVGAGSGTSTGSKTQKGLDGESKGKRARLDELEQRLANVEQGVNHSSSASRPPIRPHPEAGSSSTSVRSADGIRQGHAHPSAGAHDGAAATATAGGISGRKLSQHEAHMRDLRELRPDDLSKFSMTAPTVDQPVPAAVNTSATGKSQHQGDAADSATGFGPASRSGTNAAYPTLGQLNDWAEFGMNGGINAGSGSGLGSGPGLGKESDIFGLDQISGSNSIEHVAAGGAYIFNPAASAGPGWGAGLGNMGAMVWPDWPRDLPQFEVVEHVVNVFFDKVPTLGKMIHRSTFMANLSLPPSHSRFPCRALIHAMLAISANHISETSLSSRAYFPSGTPASLPHHPEFDFVSGAPARTLGFSVGSAHTSLTSPLARFQLWHRRKAFEAAPEYFDRGDKLLQVVQAHVIATTVDQYNAWWVDLWMESGTCVRMAVPLCLNETPRSHPEALHYDTEKRFLPPPSSPLEQSERDRTWWNVYMLESSVTVSSTWPMGIDDEEITVDLPVVQTLFDANVGDMQGSQTIHSPDFFSAHPAVHTDSYNLLIKAFKLRNDVGRFFRRYLKGAHSVSKYANDPRLRVLLSQIHAFRLGCPPHLRRPMQSMGSDPCGDGALDVDLVSAFTITHSASIALGEPLVSSESWTHDMARMCLAAIRAVLSLLYEITATSFDLTLFPAHVSHTWAQCVRCLCRFMNAAADAQDYVSVEVFRAEVEVFRLALKRYGERFPIGARQLKMCDEQYYATAGQTANKIHPLAGLICGKSDVFPIVERSISVVSTPRSASISISMLDANGQEAYHGHSPPFAVIKPMTDSIRSGNSATAGMGAGTPGATSGTSGSSYGGPSSMGARSGLQSAGVSPSAGSGVGIGMPMPVWMSMGRDPGPGQGHGAKRKFQPGGEEVQGRAQQGQQDQWTVPAQEQAAAAPAPGMSHAPAGWTTAPGTGAVSSMGVEGQGQAQGDAAAMQGWGFGMGAGAGGVAASAGFGAGAGAFDISTFSFDFDAVAELFAGSEGTLMGSEYVVDMRG